MNEFERALADCLEALRTGSDLESCLLRYPQQAAQLRPHLEVADALLSAYDAAPTDEFAQNARERFLVASGQRLQEAFDNDPSPSFFAVTRVKFLMTAQRMKLNRNAQPQHRGLLFGAPFRALAGAGVAMVMFLSFSTYTVASANNALPGDWRYPVKLQTERVRLALAFSDDAKQDVRIDITAERAEEIERLAAQGRTIGDDELERLEDRTASLADAVSEGDLNDDQLARVHAVAEKAKEILKEAEPQVAADALPKLEAVQALAADTANNAATVAINRTPGAVLTPVVPLDTADPTETPEPEPTATGVPSATPGPNDTVTPGASTPTPPPSPAATQPARAGLTLDETPVSADHGVAWIRLAVNHTFTTLIPSPEDGWHLAGVSFVDGAARAPDLVQLRNSDSTQLITINPRNGDMWWFVVVNGVFDEVQLRVERDDGIFVSDRDLLRHLYGPLAEVPLFVMDNIDITQEPSPTPEAPATATP